MKFSYETLLSGEPIYAEGIGHVKSPFLKELKPTSGIGTWRYNLFLNLLVWDKEEMIVFLRTISGRKLKSLDKENSLNAFDIITLTDETTKLLLDAMAFFISDKVTWDKEQKEFIVTTPDEELIIGKITRDNFDEARDAMLQVNYINVGESAKPVAHSSKKSKDLWEQAQAYLKEESKKKADDRSTNIGNVVSKLCAANTGYNLLNIYELTIFQLYDQFFQYGYLRAMNLNEMAFSNHGGEHFDMQAWLKPIIKI